MKCLVATALVCLLIAAPACAMEGSALQLNSGAIAGSTAQLNSNGYAGGYITLASPGSVTVTVNATGTASGGIDPKLNIVIADAKVEFNVSSSGSNPYLHQFDDLPAGTYFIRAGYNNDGGTSRALTINSMDVAGATMATTTDEIALRQSALAAADTYIDNFRKGPGKVALVGVAPGTSVDVRLKRHAFNFGTNIHGGSDTGLLNANPAPGSNAEKYQKFVLENFNMVVPSNGGKWSFNEGTRDGDIATGMDWADKILAYAGEHNMRARMHALVWGGSQEPTWVTNLLSDPTGTDTYNALSNPQGTNLNKLNAAYSDNLAPAGTPNVGEKSEIHERIDYYVGDGVGADRATQYSELDVYNESYHTGVNGGPSSIWNRLTPAGVSNIYDDAAAAATLAGANIRLYTNEYSVLEAQGGDAYANWYRNNIEAVENADGDPFDKTVGGIGVQYYSNAGHSANTIMKALQNLSVLGLPITLSEFGVAGSLMNGADRIRNVTEAHRMLFGTPDATGFLYWGWWASATNFERESSGVLVDANFNLTPVGLAWKALRDSWNTVEEDLIVGPDGTIDFTGFYGDYEIFIGDDTQNPYDLLLSKGDSLYSLVVAAGDYNADGVVDAGDFTVWRDTLGSFGDLRADGNGNELIDEDDYAIWKSNFGATYLVGGGAVANVPEPACISLVSAALAAAACIRRRL